MLRIGQLAAAARVPANTIRYYEAVGLLPQPARSAAGYRLYPRSEVRWLKLVKQAKLLGLSLPEVKDLVDQTFTGTCAHLQRSLLERIPAQVAEVERRIAELHALKQELVAMWDHLRLLDGTRAGDPVVECENCPCVAGMEGN